MTKIIVALRNFANAPKNSVLTCLCFQKPASLVCISLCEIHMTDLNNEMLSMKHVKFKFWMRLKFAAATQVIKRTTKFVQKQVMIYLDCSKYFNL